jgi:hypothetical protein
MSMRKLAARKRACQVAVFTAVFLLSASAVFGQNSTHKTSSKKNVDANAEQLKPLAPDSATSSPQPAKAFSPSGFSSCALDSMQPFLKTINFDIAAGTTQGNIPITIPEGKRLVIEYVSVRAQGPTGQKFIAQIQTNVAHTESLRGKIWLVFFPQGTFSGIDVFTASQPMHVYAEQSAPPALFVATRSDISGTAFIEATISGYIVNMHR